MPTSKPYPSVPSSCILAADLHLNTKERDAHRWSIWDKIADACNRFHLEHIVLLGDLTDAKDFHSSHLVNGIVNSIVDLTNGCNRRVYVLRGNHDGIDPNEPYFGFLGFLPSVQYFDKATSLPLSGGLCAFLPHMTDEAFMAEIDDLGRDYTGVVFAHVTVAGSIPGPVRGVSPRALDRILPKAMIYSGDVHTPQRFENIEYVGAPYHTNFGDSYEPRLLAFPKGSVAPLIVKLDMPRKVLVDLEPSTPASEIFYGLDLKKGDQVKVRVNMLPSQVGDWQATSDIIRTLVANANADLVSTEFKIDASARPEPGVSDQPGSIPWRARAALKSYCEQHKLSREVENAGFECFDQAER